VTAVARHDSGVVRDGHGSDEQFGVGQPTTPVLEQRLRFAEPP
jgi:hypothetical protein